MNDEAVCRTAPATPGLLKKLKNISFTEIYSTLNFRANTKARQKLRSDNSRVSQRLHDFTLTSGLGDDIRLIGLFIVVVATVDSRTCLVDNPG